MTTRDTPEAAMAAALHQTDIPDEITDGDHWQDSEWCIDIEAEWAAAILAALDGWALVPNGLTFPSPSWLRRWADEIDARGLRGAPR